jgi:hypothetical protein
MHAYKIHAYEMHAYEMHDAGKVSFVPKLPYLSPVVVTKSALKPE